MNTYDIQELEREWERPEGFLGAVREGKYDQESGERFICFLKSLDFGDDQLVPRRFVSLLWYVPSFLEWQTERIEDVVPDIAEYQRFVNRVRNEIERILGTP